MKILLINHYAGSPRHGMEFRPYYLAREWVRMGHQVLILAASESQCAQHAANPGGETIDGIAYCWYRTPAYSGNGPGPRDEHLVLLPAGLEGRRRAGRGLRAGCRDRVQHLSDGHLGGAARGAQGARPGWSTRSTTSGRCRRSKLSGMSAPPPVRNAVARRPRTMPYRDADAVVSMLPKVHRHMASHGLDLNKLTVIPTASRSMSGGGEVVPLDAGIAAHIALQHAAGRRVLGYAGSHGLPNALDVLLDAAKLLKDAPIAIVMVGGGHEKARLEQRVRDEGIANVAMFAPIPKLQIPNLLSAFDIAYIGWQRTPIYRFGIAPNKLMDYMMAKRPVLHSTRPERSGGGGGGRG